MRGPALGSRQIPTKVCPRCDYRFFTQVGLDEHARVVHGVVDAAAMTTTPLPLRVISPAGLLAMQAAGRRIAALNNARRRRCACGHESTPAGIGLHQKSTGHAGWKDVP